MWPFGWIKTFFHESGTKKQLREELLAAKYYFNDNDHTRAKGYLMRIERTANDKYKLTKDHKWAAISKAATEGLAAYQEEAPVDSDHARVNIDIKKLPAEMQLCFKKLKKAIRQIP